MCLTGLQDVQIDHYEMTDAVVGQNVTLSCIIKRHLELKIVNIEWSKKNNEAAEFTKLALYSSAHGFHSFWPNVTMELGYNNSNQSMGSYLHLPAVKKWDSGIYICDVATFPLGSIKAGTEVKIRGKTKALTRKATHESLHQTLQPQQDSLFA